MQPRRSNAAGNHSRRAHALEEWWREVDRTEQVLGRVGPDDICCAGLTPRQTAILKTLVEREGARLSDLAEAVGLSASALTRVLEKLERQDLVERVRGVNDDGRAAMVRISERGRQVRHEIDELMRTRCRAIVDAIPADKREQVLEALRIFNAALEKVDCGCRALGEPGGGCCVYAAAVVRLARRRG
jgi:DNA-binding MarR family transcriptional regulator